MAAPLPEPRRIDLIVVHCTGTRINATRTAIERYWREELGWRRPGYHYLVEPNGRVHVLQPHQFPTNGVAGHNAHAIHLSYIGGLNADGAADDTRTKAQELALRTLVLLLTRLYPQARVCGHNELAAKACPCFDVPTWWREVKDQIAANIDRTPATDRTIASPTDA